MPVYEYLCESCGEFERTQRITDPPLERCPSCRRKVRRLISNTSFQLKGGGWYVTDYARAGKAGGDTTSTKESTKDSSGSSESSSSKSSGGKTAGGKSAGGKSASADA
jgi:putative FmdB family regulatory protein